MADDDTFVLREVFAKLVAPILGQTCNLTVTGSDESKLYDALQVLSNPALSKIIKFEPNVTRHDNGSFTLQVSVPRGVQIDHKALWAFVNSYRGLGELRAEDSLQIEPISSGLSYSGTAR